MTTRTPGQKTVARIKFFYGLETRTALAFSMIQILVIIKNYARTLSLLTGLQRNLSP